MELHTIIRKDYEPLRHDGEVILLRTEEELLETVTLAQENGHTVHLISKRTKTYFGDHIDGTLTVKVDSKKIMEALFLVLMDKRVKTDALFVHGSSVASVDLDKKVLTLASDIYKEGHVKNIVINSLPQSICQEKNIAYPGYEVWKKELDSLGVDTVAHIESSLHTALEADNLITLALAKGWGSITIMTLPHHLLRCMCQMVYCLKKREVNLKVYARTLEGVSWDMSATKPVLGSASAITGSLFDHIDAEHQRLEKYMDPRGIGYTPHATLEELISYIQMRG